MTGEVTVSGCRMPNSSVAWLVSRGLSRREAVYQVMLVIAGPLFFFILGYAKGSFVTLESLLSLLPLAIASRIRGAGGVACTGDSAETYTRRPVPSGRKLARLTRSLQSRGLLALKSPHHNYMYLLNIKNLHYVRPWHEVNFEPTKLTVAFGIYAAAVLTPLPLPAWNIVEDLRLLQFAPGSEHTVALLSLGIAALGLLAVLATAKRGVKVGCQGGRTPHAVPE